MWIRIGFAALVGALIAPVAVAVADAPSPPAAASVTSKSGKRARRPVRTHRGSTVEKLASATKKRAIQKWPARRPKQTPAAFGVPHLGSIPFPQGERLVFRVKMLGAEAADVVLGIGRRTVVDGRPVVPLVGWLRSSEFLSKFYPIDDKLVTLVDERTFLPLRTEFDIKEAGKEVRRQTTFDHEASRIDQIKERKGSKTIRRNFAPVASLFDAMSSVHAARRLDLSVGLAFSYYVWDGRRERLITVRVTGTEKIWTRIGWFDCAKLEVTSRITGGFIKQSDLDLPETHGTAWIALDAHRTPIKLQTPTRLGAAEAILVRRYIDAQDSAQAAVVKAADPSAEITAVP